MAGLGSKLQTGEQFSPGREGAFFTSWLDAANHHGPHAKKCGACFMVLVQHARPVGIGGGRIFCGLITSREELITGDLLAAHWLSCTRARVYEKTSEGWRELRRLSAL